MPHSFIPDLPRIPLIYAIFLAITVTALGAARVIRSRGRLEISSSMLSPMGSLYSLTTAFLLSNVIFGYSNLRTAVTQEVVTINKLGAVVAVLPPDARLEARRLLFDYAQSISGDESQSMRQGKRSDLTQLALGRLLDFLGSEDAELPPNLPRTPESNSYLRKASDFAFELMDARERRLSLAGQAFPRGQWLAIGVMYAALALLAYLVQGGRWTVTWVSVILMLSAPVPCVLLHIYSHPFSSGLLNIASVVDAVLERSL